MCIVVDLYFDGSWLSKVSSSHQTISVWQSFVVYSDVTSYAALAISLGLRAIERVPLDGSKRPDRCASAKVDRIQASTQSSQRSERAEFCPALAVRLSLPQVSPARRSHARLAAFSPSALCACRKATRKPGSQAARQPGSQAARQPGSRTDYEPQPDKQPSCQVAWRMGSMRP